MKESISRSVGHHETAFVAKNEKPQTHDNNKGRDITWPLKKIAKQKVGGESDGVLQ